MVSSWLGTQYLENNLQHFYTGTTRKDPHNIYIEVIITLKWILNYKQASDDEIKYKKITVNVYIKTFHKPCRRIHFTFKKHILDKELTSASSQIDLSSNVTAAILSFVFKFLESNN